MFIHIGLLENANRDSSTPVFDLNFGIIQRAQNLPANGKRADGVYAASHAANKN